MWVKTKDSKRFRTSGEALKSPRRLPEPPRGCPLEAHRPPKTPRGRQSLPGAARASSVVFLGGPGGPPRGPERPPEAPGEAPRAPQARPPASPPHPDPAQNLVKHEGFEQPTQTSACGSTSQAPLEIIKEMGQKSWKKAWKTPPSTPKDPRETPKTTNHDGTVAPSGRPWPRTKDPKGAPKTPLGHRGAAKTAPKKNPEPLNKKRRGQEKDNTTTPQF